MRLFDQPVAHQYGDDQGVVVGPHRPIVIAGRVVCPHVGAQGTHAPAAEHLRGQQSFGDKSGLYRALAKRHTEITIQFKQTPFVLFRNAPGTKHTNQLVIQIQPVEGISLSFGAKIPGPILRVGSVDMSFEYSKYFRADAYTGYEVLLYDCMIGDATLFQRADMVEAGWSVVDPVLDVWKALPPRRFPNYMSGTWGPKESEDLLQRDGREWRKIP